MSLALEIEQLVDAWEIAQTNGDTHLVHVRKTEAGWESAFGDKIPQNTSPDQYVKIIRTLATAKGQEVLGIHDMSHPCPFVQMPK